MATEEKRLRFWLIFVQKDGKLEEPCRGVYGQSKSLCEAIRSAIWKLESSPNTVRVCIFGADQDRNYRIVADLQSYDSTFGVCPQITTDMPILESDSLMRDIANDLNTGCQKCGAKSCQ